MSGSNEYTFLKPKLKLEKKNGTKTLKYNTTKNMNTVVKILATDFGSFIRLYISCFMITGKEGQRLTAITCLGFQMCSTPPDIHDIKWVNLINLS